MTGPPPSYPPPPYPAQYNYQPPYQPPPPSYANPYSKPPPQQQYNNRPVRTKPMYLEPPKPSNAIFIKSLPYDLTVDEFNQLFGKFGEIASTFTNHIHDRGIAFVTYYNILSAKKAVEKMKNIKVHERSPVTTFSFKPPNYSRIDPRTTSTIVLVQPTSAAAQQSSVALTQEMVSQAMSKFGEIYLVREIAPNQITVQFCDMRLAKHAAESGANIDINGINCRVELYVEPDGEVIYQPVPPPSYQQRGPPPPPPPPQYSPPPQYMQPQMQPQPQPPIYQQPPPQYQPPALQQYQQQPQQPQQPIYQQPQQQQQQMQPQYQQQPPQMQPPYQQQPPQYQQYSSPPQTTQQSEIAALISKIKNNNF